MLARWAQPERPPMGTTCAHHGYSDHSLASAPLWRASCSGRQPARESGVRLPARLPSRSGLRGARTCLWLPASHRACGLLLRLCARTPRHSCRGAVQSGRRAARRRRAALARSRRAVAAGGGSQLSRVPRPSLPARRVAAHASPISPPLIVRRKAPWRPRRARRGWRSRCWLRHSWGPQQMAGRRPPPPRTAAHATTVCVHAASFRRTSTFRGLLSSVRARQSLRSLPASHTTVC